MTTLGWWLSPLGPIALRQMGTLFVTCFFLASYGLGRHFGMNMVVGSGQLSWWYNDKEGKTEFPQILLHCLSQHQLLMTKRTRWRLWGRFWSMPRSFHLLSTTPQNYKHGSSICNGRKFINFHHVLNLVWGNWERNRQKKLYLCNTTFYKGFDTGYNTAQ